MSFVAGFNNMRLSIIRLLPLFIFLSACGGKGSEEELRILGNPPGRALLGVEYKYDFGIAGGDGIPTVSLSNAPRWLSAEYVDNAARKGVVIRGVPGVSGPGAGLADLSGSDSIEVTLNVYDGGSRASRIFWLEVGENIVSMEGVEVTEGVENELPSEDGEPLTECVVTPSVKELPGDTWAYVPVRLTAPSVQTVSVAFRTAEANGISLATPEEDYLDHEGIVTFKPGETLCYVKVLVRDDNVAEDTEGFSLVLQELVQGLASISARGSSNIHVRIRDNEPVVSWDIQELVLTEGKEVEVKVTLDRSSEIPVVANFVATVPESGNTGDDLIADSNDYCIQLDVAVDQCDLPDADGIYSLAFAKGETEKTIVIKALDDERDASVADEQLELEWVRSDSVREGAETLRVHINEWKRPLVFALEQGLSVREMQTDFRSNVYVGYSGTRPGEANGVRVYNRHGDPTPLQEIEFIGDGHSEYLRELVDIHMKDDPDAIKKEGEFFHYLYMLGNVEGNIDGQSAGGKDVVVQMWRQRNEDPFELVWTRQYGSAYDDIAHALHVDTNGVVYVVGETQGRFEGGYAGAGQDAFIIKFDSDGTFLYALNKGVDSGRESFMDVTGPAVSSQIVVTGYSTSLFMGAYNGSRDIILGAFNREGMLLRGRQDGNVEDNVGTAVALIDRHVVGGGYTRGVLLERTGKTAGGEDAYISFYSDASTRDDTVQFGSAGDDRVLDVVTDGDSIFATGFAEGPLFSGCSHYGGKDAFLVRYDWDREELKLKSAASGSGCAAEDEEGWPLQRGTSANEQGSHLAITSSRKLMWLTERESDSGNTVEIRPYNLNGQSLLLNDSP